MWLSFVRAFVFVLLLCLLSSSVYGLANSDDDADGFDDADGNGLIKTSTEISSANLNPFRVEVFVSYCMACSGRGSFDNLKKFLEGRFPEVVVRGDNHPPTPLGNAAIIFAGALQVVGTILAFAGEHVFSFVGLERSAFAQTIAENKIQILGGAFMLNSVAQSAAKTDAFEIFINGELIFSKLEKKRMPSVEEIVVALSKRGVSLQPYEAVTQAAQRQQM